MPGSNRHAIDRIARHLVHGTPVVASGDAELARVVARRLRSKLAAVGIPPATAAPGRARRSATRAVDPRQVDLVITRVDKLLASHTLSVDGRAHSR